MTIASASERIRTRLHDRLSRETRAEVYFDRGRRGLYATDASLYQIDPLGVVVPRTMADVVQVVKIAAEEGAPVLPRGAATSLSGQTVGPAIIIDFSKYLNRIGVVDRDRMTVRVEPGVVLDTAGRASQAAGTDVRARCIDQRPRDAGRDDRQQLGRSAIAAVRQDGRSRPFPRCCPGRWHHRDVRSARRRRARRRLRPAGPVRAGPPRCPRRGGGAPRGHCGEVPADPPPGQRLQPRRVRPGPGGPARRLARGGVAVQPGAADRRLRGDAGDRHRGRAEGGAAPPGAGPGGAFVRHDPRGARPAGRDRRDRPGGRRDARPDDPGAGGEEPALFALPQLRRRAPRRRPGRAVLRRQPGGAGRAGQRSGRTVRGHGPACSASAGG